MMITYLVEKTWITNGGSYPRQWFGKIHRDYVDRDGAQKYLKTVRHNFYQDMALGDMPSIRFFEQDLGGSKDFTTTWDHVDIDTMELTGHTVAVHESRIGTTFCQPVDLPASWTRKLLPGQEWPKPWHECR